MLLSGWWQVFETEGLAILGTVVGVETLQKKLLAFCHGDVVAGDEGGTQDRKALNMVVGVAPASVFYALL